LLPDFLHASRIYICVKLHIKLHVVSEMRQAENAYSLVFFCAILSAIKDKQNGMILPSLFPAGEKIDPSESNLDL